MKAIGKSAQLKLILSLLILLPIAGQNLYAQESAQIPRESDGPGWIKRPIELENIAAYQDPEDHLENRTPKFLAVFDRAIGYMPARLWHELQDQNPRARFRYGIKTAPDGTPYAYVEIDGYGEYRIGDIGSEPELIEPHPSIPVREPDYVFPISFIPGVRIFSFPHPRLPGWNRYFIGLTDQPRTESCVMLLIDVARNY